MAEEQSVVGLVTAGLEHIIDLKAPQDDVYQFIGEALQLEWQNQAMNEFVAQLIDELRKEGIYSILLKGQGVAQCYEKPLWRACGDIDLLLDDKNYEKAKQMLLPLAGEVESEYKAFKHIGMTMQNGVVVELHGTLHSRLSKRLDNMIDAVQEDTFKNGNVRSWQNGNTSIHIPKPDNDIIFIFTHILHHFYIEGIGLRQICDWCRLLWTYRSELDLALLKQRLQAMGLMNEWRAFAAFAVDWLGMPVEAMPLYSPDKRWSHKAERILEFVLETGNFGHKREMSRSENFIIGKVQAAWYKLKDFGRHAQMFPMDSVKFFFHFMRNGLVIAIN